MGRKGRVSCAFRKPAGESGGPKDKSKEKPGGTPWVVVRVVGSGSKDDSYRGRALELDKDDVQRRNGVRLPHILRQTR